MNSENTNYIYNYIKYYYFSVDEFRDESMKLNEIDFINKKYYNCIKAVIQ